MCASPPSNSPFPDLPSQTRRVAVPHRAMAVDAPYLAVLAAGPHHEVVHECGVAVQAALLQDAAHRRLDHDRLVEVLERERLRVVEAAHALGEPLPDETVRQVAIDAGRHGVVAALLPRVV